MNLLLVDDEVLSVKLFKDSIDWSALGITNLHCAYNAHQAKQVICQNKIHICICDIEMPQENGLQLINWIYEHDPGIVNIILTCHPDFSYAREAISLGVFRFVVKPVSHDEISSVLLMAVERITQNNLVEKQRKYGEYLLINARSEADVEQWLAQIVAQINNTLHNEEEKTKVVNRIRQYIENHYMEAITTADIEKQIFLNRDHISRVFKKNIGFSLMEYLQYYRITVAKKMLHETNASISSISTQVGFGSSAYFAKIFKKWTDVTPVEYRASWNSSQIMSEML
jgi:YesN/AraC family two-component response regulator